MMVWIVRELAQCKDHNHDNSLCSDSSWTDRAMQPPDWHR